MPRQEEAPGQEGDQAAEGDDAAQASCAETGARAGEDGETDVVLHASEKVFRAILSGEQNPVTAYMTGKLKVEGNAMRALKVSDILTAT